MSEQVNHPSHYNAGKIETIDIIDDLGFADDFYLGNVIKYLARAKHKGTELADLQKAKWYLDRKIVRVQKAIVMSGMEECQ